MKCQKKEILEIVGGNKLFGEFVNQTSKNATLPIMSACLICAGKTKIKKVPNITDIHNMIKILRGIGCKIFYDGSTLTINSNNASNEEIRCELMKSMRSSIFLLGSMLNRFKACLISLPGGCAIGNRPIDIHISALKRLNVKVYKVGEMLAFDARKAKAKAIKLKFASVGATENLIQFACTLKGKTTIKNAAKEPEVVDLCNFLNLCGAKILGAGTNKITIYGVSKLKCTEYEPISDRIVAGTVMCAVAACGGKVTIKNASASENKKIIEKLSLMGCQISVKNDIITIARENPLVSAKQISTGVYPSFPTDLQSLMLAVSCLAEGKTTISENLFENRFLTVSELVKMGASVKLGNNHQVEVEGVKTLNASTLQAKDLRGGASLVVLALAASGKSVISGVEYIDRGYVSIENIFSSLGGNIKRKWQN